MSKHWKPAVSELQHGVRDLHLGDVSDDTKVTSGRLHSTQRREEPLVTPIYNSSTYKLQSVDHYLDILKDGGYIYSRLGNPTCEAAEAAVSTLEGGAGALLFASGMAAITTSLLAFLKAGDHIVACNPCYSGTYSFIKNHLNLYKIEVTWVPTGCSVDEYKKRIKPNTRVLYGETPCNPLISLLDLPEFGQLGLSLGGRVVTMVDSTYGSPYLQQPHQYGVDLVIHSGTKYLGGHSDLLAGIVSTKTEDQWKNVNTWRTTMGTVLSPYEASLLTRGIKTLHVRMHRHCSNAQKVAEFLESQDKVDKVYYPGLESHPGHSVAKKQMRMFGGMISFEMKGLEPARILVESVRVIQLAVSLGGVESLIEHPATMTHGPMLMSDADRREGLISDGLIRLSVGLEDPDDLIKDLQYALDKIPG